MRSVDLMRRFRSLVHQGILVLFWWMARMSMSMWTSALQKSNVAILVPADPLTLIGSRGDEAMLMAVIAAVEQRAPSLNLRIASSSVEADALAASMGLGTLRIWGGILMPFRFLGRLRETHPSVGLVTGADIMDGYYSPVMSLRMLIAADLLARWGARTSLIGFSMNERPAPLVMYAFRRLDRRVKVNLRDSLSWERYERLIGCEGHLVADAAFLLAPAARFEGEHEAIADWMKRERSQGRIVLILNLHPMLFASDESGAGIERLVRSVTAMMRDATYRHAVSWVLLPHDDRVFSGDMTTLAELHRQLEQDLHQHVRLVDRPPRAAEIKALLGFANGAITGRMHLAIAALDQSVPVMAFAYQGKFSGLLRHFEMPDWLVIDAGSIADGNFLCRQVERFIREMPALSGQIRARLPKVIAAAEANFNGIL